MTVRQLQSFQLADIGAHLNRPSTPNAWTLFEAIESYYASRGQGSPFYQGFRNNLDIKNRSPFENAAGYLIETWGQTSHNPTVAELAQLLVKIGRVDIVDSLVFLRNTGVAASASGQTGFGMPQAAAAASSTPIPGGRKIIRKQTTKPMPQFLIVCKRGDTVYEKIETDPIESKADADELLQAAATDPDYKGHPLGIITLESVINKTTSRVETTTHAVIVEPDSDDAPAAAAAAPGAELHIPEPSKPKATAKGRSIGGRVITRATKKIDDYIVVHRIGETFEFKVPDDGPFDSLDQAKEAMEDLAAECSNGEWATYVAADRVDINAPKVKARAMAKVVHA